ncbi:hypothetical protein [Rodentibacter pneumotropicus]|uniref:hypothetical protein n=1 Tax=Rodentibacter pneumotropicus TaxID=758 RepID=UPI001F29FDD7|nr:hypothetical protein [Rodentibacter pneumotropicus]
MMKLGKTTILLLTSLFLLGCEKSFSEQFYKDRHCVEIKYECLNESQNKMTQENNMFKPMQLNKEQWDDIQYRKKLKIYGEVAKMLEIYYPVFWGDKDETFQIQWIEKVDQLTLNYDPNRRRADLETMAAVCAIIGSDFEENSKYNFVVNKLKKGDLYLSSRNILDYLRFEVLNKDFDEAGRQYNTWSLRGVQDGMPHFTRRVPNFNTEWREDNEKENVWSIYKNNVRGNENL